MLGFADFSELKSSGLRRVYPQYHPATFTGKNRYSFPLPDFVPAVPIPPTLKSDWQSDISSELPFIESMFACVQLLYRRRIYRSSLTEGQSSGTVIDLIIV